MSKAEPNPIILRDAIRARLYDWDNQKTNAPSVKQMESALAALGYPGSLKSSRKRVP